jgi:hypothetical protein
MKSSIIFFNIITQIMNRLQTFFDGIFFKDEYVKLLEIGAILGYILIIIFLFMIQYTQLSRLIKIRKYPLLLMMVIQIFVTTIALVLPIIIQNLGILLFSFVCYITFFITIELMKDNLTNHKQFKYLQSN